MRHMSWQLLVGLKDITPLSVRVRLVVQTNPGSNQEEIMQLRLRTQKGEYACARHLVHPNDTVGFI